MNYSLDFIFVGEAEAHLAGAEGIIHVEPPQGHLPMPGDRVTLRVAPDKQPVAFVCRARHFDFSEGAECSLRVELDLA